MAFFNWFNDNLGHVKAQGCEVEPEVSKLTADYGKQADKADRLLQEKQARARKERKEKKNS
ncbi:hypothetical protein K9N68_11975 [Kovacikia minuta CCNUW1]|uniref:hypothetical protein n=1 Tax=Kovacikia minuta TaxID=2931930 RepID=UPI001CCDA893|nr:hypothetical protein [Kovacikia minuta]UBF28524.1 hypothetical protein K9N68_11975 [Kovacikia minuta CCNUW1]